MRKRTRFCAIVAGLLAILPAGPATAQEDPWLSELDQGPIEIELSVSAGLSTDRITERAPSKVVEDIKNGVDLSEAVRRIFIYRAFGDRLLLDIDYDASRSETGFFGDGDIYALHYIGQPEEILRSASIGNRILDDPTDEVTPEQPGAGEIAASVSTGWQTREGELVVDGSLRYGTSDDVELVYRGANRQIDLDLLDVDHLRRQIYLVPDPGLDEGSLELRASVASGGEFTVDGVAYEPLVRGIDYSYDPTRGWIYLERTLRTDQYLIVRYEVNGIPVGSPTLGTLAYIDVTGTRVDFTEAAFPSQFVSDGTRSYLALARPGEASYWEHRGAYEIGDLDPESPVRDIAVSLRFTDTGRLNAAYDSLIDSYEIDLERGLFIFSFEDSVGFYPRPFPGPNPYTATTSPGNPFATDNPVYGDVTAAEASDSVHTISLRLTQEIGAYQIADIFIPGSVSVIVDGRPLSGTQFSVDEATGIVSIRPGLVSRGSEVIIRYRLAGAEAEAATVVGRIDATYTERHSRLDSALELSVPVTGPAAPEIGQAGGIEISGSQEFAVRLLPAIDAANLDLRVSAETSASRPGKRGITRVAGMEPSSPRSIGLSESAWLPASPSLLLPALGTPVPLGDRGALLYENYRDTGIFGTALREIGWDNSGNPQFSYDEKAGPYNTADAPVGESGASLAIEYDSAAGAADPYVTVATSLSGNLDAYTSLCFGIRGLDLETAPVRVYVELLTEYQEDLDGDDQIDAESSPGVAGIAITPVGGTQTRIGTDPWGESDGVIVSEDLDTDGRLEPAGTYALDTESGVVIPGASADYATELPLGTSAWRTVRLDLESVAAPELLDRVRTIRVTIVPLTDDARGIVLLNDLRFEREPVTNVTPATLSIETLSGDESPLADAPLAEAFPEQYDRLRGPADFREAQAETEAALKMSLVPTLAAGERAYVSASVPAGSLERFGAVTVFVLRPAATPIPVALGLDLRASGGPGDSVVGTISVSELNEGWNELRLEFDDGASLWINGTAAGSVAVSGSGTRFATSVQLGFAADGSDVTSAYEIWTDEWFAGDGRWDLAASGSAELTLAWNEVVDLGTAFPILGPGSLDVRYGIAVDSAATVHEAGVSASAALFRAARAEGSWELSRPSDGEASGYDSLDLGYAYEPGQRWIPGITHEFTRRRDTLASRDAVEGQTEASVGVAFEIAGDETQSVALAGSRAVNGRTVVAESTVETAAMLDSISFALNGLPAGLDLSAAYDHRFAGTGLKPAPAGDYLQLVASLAGAPERIVEDAALVSRGYEGEIDYSLPGERTVTADLGLSGAFLETEGALAERIEISLGLPISLGDWTITPSMVREASASVRGFTASQRGNVVTETAVVLLFPPAGLIAPGVAWTRATAVNSLDRLAAIGSGASGLVSEASVAMRYRGSRDVIPGRAEISASAELSSAGPVYGMVERQRASLGKTITRPSDARLSVFSIDGSFEHEADLLLDTRTVGGSASVYYTSTRMDDTSISVTQSLSLNRTWQDAGDPRLQLFPQPGGREEPAPFRPDEWRWNSSTATTYRWSTARGPTRATIVAANLGIETEPLEVRNEERIVMTSSGTLTDEPPATPQTSIPFGLTMSHRSEIQQTESLSVAVGLTAQGGLEQTQIGTTMSRTAAFGLEGSVSLIIRY